MAKRNTIKSKVNKRTLKQPNYKSFQLSKPIKYSGRRLPSSWQLFRHSCGLLWRYKKPLGGILLIYGLAQIIFVQGAFTANLSDLKDAASNSGGGVGGSLNSFSYLLGSVGQTSSAGASAYQSLLFIIGSLAFIWALRQLMAAKRIRIRDAYYKGMYPLIPFFLVLVIIGIQMMPALIGAWLYGVVTTNGIAASFIEYVFWFVIFLVFALLSFYMICSSLFALYIVTLPDMTPMKALRSARELVLHRRHAVARKLVAFLIAVVILSAVITLPVILLLPGLASIVFYSATVLAVGFMHTYIYNIYRELLVDE